jgi:hypothetical protein
LPWANHPCFATSAFLSGPVIFGYGGYVVFGKKCLAYFILQPVNKLQKEFLKTR